MAVKRYNGTAWVTEAGGVPQSTVAFRNILINAAFAIDQRGYGSGRTIVAGDPIANGYTVDRWYSYCTGANVTTARVAGTAPDQYYHRFTGATSNTAVGFGQRIEAANSNHFAGQTATLSVSLASTSLTSVTWTAFYANTTDTFGTLASPTRTSIATGTFTINSTLTRYSANISVPTAATTGIEIVFTGGALVASQTLTFSNVQFELGTSATTFERRPIGTELALCQRYFTRYTAGANGTFGYGLPQATVTNTYSVAMPVPMRITPVVGGTSGTFTSYSAANSQTLLTLSVIDQRANIITYSGTVSTAQGGPLILYLVSGAILDLYAEL